MPKNHGVHFVLKASKSAGAKGDVPHFHFFLVQLRNGILLPKLFIPTIRKKYSSDREKLLTFEAEGQKLFKFFEITRTIYSSREQLLVTKCFFLRVHNFLISFMMNFTS